ncbi:hypothetical protein [Candidatus Poriferisodalis sp.]|uniref:hypothetical protein n=1 Tax=Candidatus Poriferisodalis sp. TaxID=3101277 RepID=UPI003AF7816D
MPGYTYDTGALIAAERNDRRVWALHQGVLPDGLTVPIAPRLTVPDVSDPGKT